MLVKQIHNSSVEPCLRSVCKWGECPSDSTVTNWRVRREKKFVIKLPTKRADDMQYNLLWLIERETAVDYLFLGDNQRKISLPCPRLFILICLIQIYLGGVYATVCGICQPASAASLLTLIFQIHDCADLFGIYIFVVDIYFSNSTY